MWIESHHVDFESSEEDEDDNQDEREELEVNLENLSYETEPKRFVTSMQVRTPIAEFSNHVFAV